MASFIEHRSSGNLDDAALARHEAQVTRLAWAVRVVTITLASFPMAFVMVFLATEPWHHVTIAVLIALPVLFGIPMATLIRHQHIALLRRYQAQLVMRTVELQEMAARDELTGVYNRRYFYERLQEGLERGRTTKQPLALLLLDVDGLKEINDSYGHRVGDVVLRNLAKIMTKQVRASDVVGRLGGDEFGIIMPDTDKRGAFAMARRLWRELAESPIYQGNGISIHVNASIGVSGYPWGGDDVDQMMHWADADMYANKTSRKAPVSTWAPEGVPPDIEAAPSDYA